MSPEGQSVKTNSLLTQFLKNELATNRLKEGDVVEATLIRKTSRSLFFDLGKFGTGIVYGAELLNARDTIRDLTPGSSLPAKVIDLDGDSGYIELSLAEAGKQRSWQQAQELQESGEIVKIKIVGANSGGLIGSLFDLKAFLPLSHLSNEHYNQIAGNDRPKMLETLKSFVGQEFNVKILNVNRRSGKLIVSEREMPNTNLKELLTQYQVNQVVDGIVSGIADFGIFVKFADNPQIEGLVHISEINHRLIDNPKEVVNIGEAVKVKIINLKENRVFLSLKALQPDPWEKISELLSEGKTVRGKVYKYNPFGAIVNLPHDLQGAIHVSEFGDLEKMKKALPLGSEHEFVVESIKPADKRITLKLKM